ncbi:HNH endonuclease signature motif containing protein [Burkholderia glumae]|uniref:HNH endonuclease n=1 Tax=Burkholderia glumae TaxID=337 RepID=A0ABY5BET2_BURGL|nr:HNH endonuclease [Burkholderia glumae]QJW82489.1 HNH endonuclease [Burkholderia glumae]USS44367.1 HNH endonuclease [Burkholderia glumae]
MSRLTSAQRQQLRLKYDGRCAYCGDPLADRWHSDHIEAVLRAVETKRTASGRWKLVSGPARHPERDVVENYNPACPPCNISKGQLSIEQWRAWLAGHVNSLNTYHPIYRIAKRYGLIVETGMPVVFYFERVASAVAEPAVSNTEGAPA